MTTITINKQVYKVSNTERGEWVVERMSEVLAKVKKSGWTDGLSLCFGMLLKYGIDEGHLIKI